MARWAPFQLTTGPNSEPVFYFSFSSERPFGVRTTGGTQIWMAPFFPERAALGQDPSGPAFRMPFQILNSANHIAQWTSTVIVGRVNEEAPPPTVGSATTSTELARPFR